VSVDGEEGAGVMEDEVSVDVSEGAIAHVFKLVSIDEQTPINKSRARCGPAILVVSETTRQRSVDILPARNS